MRWGVGTLALVLTFSGVPPAVDKDQEFEVDVNLDCSGCKDSYLRGVFYKSGTNYLGLTQNNSGQWIGTSSDKTQYFHVESASYSGKLKVKPDASDSKYAGPGEYQFKVGRYAGSGGATWADPVAINISGPAPVSSPTPTPTTVSRSSPTPKSLPTPTPASAPTPVFSPPPMSTPVELAVAKPTVSPPAEVLGSSTDNPHEAKTDKTNWLAVAVMLTGGITLAAAGYLLVRRAGTMEK